MSGNNQYYGTIPNIAQAFQNDPRSKLAQSMLATGTSTAPVATGGWAVTDGLARAAQAIAGAVVNKNQEKKYSEREKAYTQGMADAARLAGTPQPAANPSAVNPGLSAAAGALAPPQAPPPTSMAAPPMNLPAGGPQGGNPPPMSPQPPLPPPMPSGGAGGPFAGMGAATASIPPVQPPQMGGGGLSPDEYYRRGIRPIEGGTDPRTGAFRTSPKGAVGPGQIMPRTGPEAARLAGLPWDERRFKSDTQYNDALGQAYFAKQLNDFGDPVKAAAAYNAGPGRVRRALRQSARSGQDFTAHLPDETKNYVRNFANAVGGGNAMAPADQNSGSAIPNPGMEEVPNGPAMPSASMPNAPQRPGEVQSNRVAMAQQLMQSGNPDLMAIAQQYLDKGLDEQNSARTLASQQEFAQGQTGYQAELNDATASRSDYRQDAYGQRRDAQGRNFQRGERYANQRFQAGQSEVDRNFRTSEREATQAYGTTERSGQEAFSAAQADLDRQNRLDVAGIRRDGKGAAQQARNAYFNTPTGLKMQKEAGEQITANNDAIGKFQRFMDLNGRQGTGGLALNTPGIAAAYRFTDSDLTEMNRIANDTTLSKIGGSLGTAISDGDRSFIMDSNIGTGSPRTANNNTAKATISALRRKNEYLMEFANAQADGTQNTFTQDWAKYSQEIPIVNYDGKRNVTIDDKPITFQQWKNAPKFDRNGRKVQ